MTTMYEDVPFSELLHHPAATAKRLDAVRALRLRRRDAGRSEEHTSELQLPCNLVCRLLLVKITSIQSPRDHASSLDVGSGRFQKCGQLSRLKFIGNFFYLEPDAPPPAPPLPPTAALRI